MKANHNTGMEGNAICVVVSSTTKIVKWKQITTIEVAEASGFSCFQYDKDSKMKANHNSSPLELVYFQRCFQYDKDSKMKANHNAFP